MATLTEQERQAVWRRWMQDNAEGCAFTKADVRAAVDALDAFMNDNAATINNALPGVFKAAATQAQKARVLTYVVERRYITGAG